MDMEALKALLCKLGRLTNFRLQQPPGIDPNSPVRTLRHFRGAFERFHWLGRVLVLPRGKTTIEDLISPIF